MGSVSPEGTVGKAGVATPCEHYMERLTEDAPWMAPRAGDNWFQYGYATVPHHVTLNPRLTDKDIRVLLVLASFAYQKPYATPSVASIAERLPVSGLNPKANQGGKDGPRPRCLRSVQDSLGRLKTEGIIAFEPDPDPSNRTGRRIVLLWRTVGVGQDDRGSNRLDCNDSGSINPDQVIRIERSGIQQDGAQDVAREGRKMLQGRGARDCGGGAHDVAPKEEGPSEKPEESRPNKRAGRQEGGRASAPEGSRASRAGLDRHGSRPQAPEPEPAPRTTSLPPKPAPGPWEAVGAPGAPGSPRKPAYEPGSFLEWLWTAEQPPTDPDIEYSVPWGGLPDEVFMSREVGADAQIGLLAIQSLSDQAGRCLADDQEIAKKSGTDPQQASQTVAKLIRKGFIVVDQDPDGGRVLMLPKVLQIGSQFGTIPQAFDESGIPVNETPTGEGLTTGTPPDCSVPQGETVQNLPPERLVTQVEELAEWVWVAKFYAKLPTVDRIVLESAMDFAFDMAIEEGSDVPYSFRLDATRVAEFYGLTRQAVDKALNRLVKTRIFAREEGNALRINTDFTTWQEPYQIPADRVELVRNRQARMNSLGLAIEAIGSHVPVTATTAEQPTAGGAHA